MTDVESMETVKIKEEPTSPPPVLVEDASASSGVGNLDRKALVPGSQLQNGFAWWTDRPRKFDNFPLTLWSLINDVSFESVFWHVSGTAFILDKAGFDEAVTRILPRLFGIDKLHNFTRQLQRYGFIEVSVADKEWSPILDIVKVPVGATCHVYIPPLASLGSYADYHLYHTDQSLFIGRGARLKMRKKS